MPFDKMTPGRKRLVIIEIRGEQTKKEGQGFKRALNALLKRYAAKRKRTAKIRRPRKPS